eukprot:ANDGO_07253.mRNA.1 hypothetical protein
MTSSSVWTRKDLATAFNANLNPFLNYFATHYDTVFSVGVHDLYDIDPAESDGVFAMANRKDAVKRWMQQIVLNPMHLDGVRRCHRYLSRHPAVFEEVSAILFPTLNFSTSVASHRSTAHGSASGSHSLQSHDAPFSIDNLPSRSQFLQLYGKNVSSIHAYLVQHGQLMKDAVADLSVALNNGGIDILNARLAVSGPQAALWFVNNCVSVSEQSLQEFWRFLANRGSGILEEFIMLLNNRS